MYRVKFSKQADKALSKAESKLASRFLKKIDALKKDRVPHDAKRLVGAERGFRIRVGKYRIVYTLVPSSKLIIISRIEKRAKAY